MIFRFNSKDGRFRTDDFDPEQFDFKKLVETQLVSKLPAGVMVDSIRISQGSNELGSPIDEFDNRPLSSFNFKNGEMFHLQYELGDVSLPSVSMNTTNTVKQAEPVTKKQLPIDDELDNVKGLIPRKSSSLCKHTEKGMCEYCSPLPPYDENYHKENNIKHISYHAYVQSLNDQTNRKDSPSSFVPPLEEPVYTKDENCPNHPPNQICSKCQPSLITLQQQRFRMVDHVEISNPQIINQFIDTWRQTGLQRIGLMIGKYEKYDEVPIGVKAKVELIYEIPQQDDIDGIILQDYSKEEANLQKMCESLELQVVGVVFTDLTDSGLGNQTVLCKRHKDSFFLSSLEVIFAARLQLLHPNVSKWSLSGVFSSKFVTCCITGNDKGEIDIFSYQVSNSAEKLVESDLISLSTHPNCVFINKDEDVNGKRRYVPEVFYNKINEYGRQVKQNAKPWFPVEFLLVSLTHGFPKDANSDIMFPDLTNFPIENRGYLHQIQSLELVPNAIGISQTGEFELEELREKMKRNFHLIYFFLFGLDLLDESAKSAIIGVVRNDELSLYKLLENESWNTMIAILMAH